jgi:hypothetical protein
VKQLLPLALVLVLGACAGPMRAAPHLDAGGIRTAQPGLTALPAPVRVSPRTVVVRAFNSRILAPTGSLLVDDDSNGPVVEAYLTRNVGEALYSQLARLLGLRGLRVLRAYDAVTPIPPEAARVLELELSHFELHRWKQEGEVVDLVRVRYRFAWQAPGRAPTPLAPAAHTLKLGPSADALEATATLLADTVLQALGEGA